MKNIFLNIIFILCAAFVVAQNIPRPNISGPKGFSVNSFTGNVFYQRTDLTLRGAGFPLSATFYFNAVQDTLDHGYGKGWSFYYNSFYIEKNDTVIIQHNDGKKDIFKLVSGTYIAPVGIYETLIKSGNTFILKSKDGAEQIFADNAHKKLTGLKDRNNNYVTIDYSGSYPSVIRNSSGRSLILNWQANRLVEVSDGDQPSKKYTYQYASDQLSAVINPLGGRMEYSYNEGNIVNMADENNNPVVLIYKEDGRVKKILSCNTEQSFTYIDTTIHQTFTSINTSAGISFTAFTYDENFRLKEVTTPDIKKIAYSYDAQNNISMFKEQNNRESKFIYSANGNLLKETDAQGFTTEYTYHPIHNKISSVKDKKGNTTSFSYDTQGNLTGITKPGNIIESFTYNAQGQLTGTTNGNGNSTTYQYNSNGDLTMIQSPIGSQLFEYGGSCCNLSKITDANGKNIFMTYDLLDRLTSVKDDLNNTTFYEYDAAGNLIKETDPNGNIKRYGYDASDRLISVQIAVGTWHYEYDGAGNFIRMKDAKGNVYNYEYDLNNRLIKETDPLGNATSYLYDAIGNITQKKEPNGNTTIFKYDEQDRLIERGYAGNTDKYSYDANGNMLAAFNNNIAYTFEYDALNRLIKKNIPSWNKSISYTYDAAGNRLSMTDPDGGINNYTYDANNRLVGLTNFANLTTTFVYDAGGWLIRQNNANGTYTNYTYDAGGRNDSIIHRKANGDTIAYNFYTFDQFGNRTTMKDKYGLHLYTYDSAKRLTHVVYADGSTESFEMDANGNRTLRTKNGNPTNYAYNNADRIISAGTSNFNFDPNGNMTGNTETGFNRIFTYDGLNRLKEVQVTPTKKWEVKYDPFGEKIEKIDTSNILTRLMYDGDNLLGELNNTNSFTIKYTTALGTDSWLMQQQSTGNYYYHKDGLNSTAVLSDLSGAAVNEYRYDVFGNVTQQNENLYNPVQYTGRLKEKILGLYDYRSRMYSSDIGRFINKDEFPGYLNSVNSLNRFTYVENNPTNYIDRDGKLVMLGLLILAGKGALVSSAFTIGYQSGNIHVGKQDKFCGKDILRSAAIGTITAPILYSPNVFIAAKVGTATKVGLTAAKVGLTAAKIKLIATKVKLATELILEVSEIVAVEFATDHFFGSACSPKEKLGSEDSKKASKDQSKKINIPIIRAFDPNEIIGPSGYDSTLRWVSSKATLPYKILFENDPDFATAPAQRVVIHCPLHPNINPYSLRLGDFGFGPFNFIVPANTAAYTNRLDVRDSLGVFVDVTAGLDFINNRAFWVFESIDPATGLASTLPPDFGFLPVNDSTRSNGEGYVTFTLQAAMSVQTRDTITEQAFIYFDINDPIATNIEKNTIDAVAPESHINTMPQFVDPAFTISWTGADDNMGSGVKNYELFVSKNNGPFALVQANIDSTSHNFVGETGASYNFYTRATDNTGNKEVAKASGDVTVIVSISPNTICPGASHYFTMPKPGTGFSYQWQVDSTGNGFVNLTNNIFHSGANTDTLVLNSPQTSFYGYKYRCIASKTGTSISSTIYILKFSVIWVGNSSTAWENASNWNCNVLPDQYTDVLIPGALVNNPFINDNTVCRSILLSSGSTLTLGAGVNLELKGK